MAIALLSLGCLAIGILWTVDAVTQVHEYSEVRVVDPWSERGAFSYAPLTPDGAPLAPGEPGYFTTEAPRLRVAFAWDLVDPSATTYTAAGDLALVVRHDVPRGGWTHTEPLASATRVGAPGEPLLLTGEVDLTAVEAALRDAGRELGEASWTFVAKVTFASTPAHAGDESAFTLPLRHTPPLYTLPPEDALAHAKDHSARESIPHVERPGLAALAQRPLAPLLLLAGALGALWSFRALTEEDAA